MLGAYSSIAPLVPRLRNLAELRISEGTKVFSADGELLATVSEENREFLPIEEIPVNLKNAIVAIEDADFYHHAGVDPRGILRAAWKNVSAGQVRQGGSTITQQLARNAYDLRRRTLQRKVQEFLLALEIERKYTKDEILELYLNEIYFGERAYGVKVAAKTYFGKSPERLTLAECALLAGLPKAPTAYNPFRSARNATRAKTRRNLVLIRMAELGYITPQQAKDAAGEPLGLTSQRVVHGRRAYRAPYFVNYVLQQAEQALGPEAVARGGLVIHTTLNWRIQQEAERLLVEGVQQAHRLRVSQGALVAVDTRTGAIKAMVGGVDYTASEFNRAVQGSRQAGSAFKPFVYTTAISQGMRPEDTIQDSPVSYPGAGNTRYVPHNYDHSFWGNITLLRALAYSRNIPAVKLTAKVGVQNVINTAYAMGLHGPFDPYLSLALGSGGATPLEMASAFSVLANGGYRVEPYAISEIDDALGEKLDEFTPSPVRVLSPSTAQTMTEMLSEVIRHGTATGAAARAGGLPFPAAGKTGTTSDYKDAWFIGWAEGMACAVWVGNDRPTEMRGVTGAVVPAPIWMRFMKAAVPILAEDREKVFVQATELDRLAASLEQKRPKPKPADETPSPPPSQPETPPAEPGAPVPGDEPNQLEPQPPEPGDTAELPPARNDSAVRNGLPDLVERVAVCAVTGKRASNYCPRVVLRTFTRGRAPTSTCPLHPDPYREE